MLTFLIKKEIKKNHQKINFDGFVVALVKYVDNISLSTINNC